MIISRLVVGMKNYYNFVANLLDDPTETPENLVYVKKLDWNGVSIAVLGLNTAWMSKSRKDIDGISQKFVSDQIETALSMITGAELKVALMHHPKEYLQGRGMGDSVERLWKDCDFALHAHLGTGSQILPTSEPFGIVVINGGSMMRGEHPNAYNWARLDFNSSEATFYMRHLSEKGWSPDPSAPFTLKFGQPLSEDERAAIHPDDPAYVDALGRRPFAEALAKKIEEAWDKKEARDGPFMVHIHGPWGSGKTSVLNFLRAHLVDKRWVVVSFNAWLHQRIRPPWWMLLNEIYKQSRSRRQVGFFHSWCLRVLWLKWRFQADWLPPLFALGLIAVVVLMSIGVIALNPNLFSTNPKGGSDGVLDKVILGLKILTAVFALGGLPLPSVVRSSSARRGQHRHTSSCAATR